MRLGRRATALGAGVALLCGALPASAYCLTHGCNDATQDCGVDETGCPVGGPRLYWDSLCVSFDVQKDGSPLRGISYAQARAAVHEGFATWLNADCGEGLGPGVRIEDYGPVECRTAEYNQDAGNANIVMFRDDSWPYRNALDTLALTTLIFNADTGEIYDADIEVNTHESPMSIGDIGPRDIDFSSVITHEIGHFLGLSHSSAPRSTMRPSYMPGNTDMATLALDDVAGICAALPPERASNKHSCDPRHGFSSECSVADNSCRLAAGAPGGFGSALAALLGLSGALLRRLRRAGRPRAANPSPRRDRGSAW